MMIDSLSVVLPCYNEEGNIEDVIDSIVSFLATRVPDFEVIAVDDGSRDATPQILGRVASRCPRLKVVTHPQNKGYGSALRSGFNEAAKDFILMMDSDRQFEITEADKLLPWAKDYEIVAGIRQERCDPLYRKILGSGFNRTVNFIFHIGVKDVDCGFKVFNAVFLKQLPLKSRTYFINTEIFVRARQRHAKVKEVPVQHLARIHGEQKTVKFLALLKLISEILKLAASH
jgi:glycosyltransferase involved in cell wall biosynthesis